MNENTRCLTVVGVVREVQLDDLAGRADTVGAYYFPAKQQVRRYMVFAIKTAIDPDSVMRSVRAAMTEYTARRTAMILASAFGIVALLLAAIGVYGVLAYLVLCATAFVACALPRRAGRVNQPWR